MRYGLPKPTVEFFFQINNDRLFETETEFFSLTPDYKLFSCLNDKSSWDERELIDLYENYLSLQYYFLDTEIIPDTHIYQTKKHTYKLPTFIFNLHKQFQVAITVNKLKLTNNTLQGSITLTLDCLSLGLKDHMLEICRNEIKSFQQQLACTPLVTNIVHAIQALELECTNYFKPITPLKKTSPCIPKPLKTTNSFPEALELCLNRARSEIRINKSPRYFHICFAIFDSSNFIMQFNEAPPAMDANEDPEKLKYLRVKGHAENRVITKAQDKYLYFLRDHKKRNAGYILFVIRCATTEAAKEKADINDSWPFENSKPCEECMKLIAAVKNIRAVIYTTAEPHTIETITRDNFSEMETKALRTPWGS